MRNAARLLSIPRPVEWLYLAAGLFLVAQYAWLADDAFVYFRYVDNLLFLRIGLVENQGEYVEGYSSPLWVLVLTLARATHMKYWTAIRLIGALSFVGFWVMGVTLQRRLFSGRALVNLPLAYLALNYAVTSHFTSGLEEPLAQVAAVGYALFMLNPASFPLQGLLAVSPLIRHELAAPLILCFVWAWVRQRRFPLRLFALTLILVGSWLLFRVWYYADLFPNTFYLKNDLDIRQGLVYLQDTFGYYYFYPVAGLAGFLALALKAGDRRIDLHVASRLMMVGAAMPVILFVVKIGGAPIHYRYFAFPFCLLVCSFGGIPDAWIDRMGSWRARAFVPALSLGVAAAVFSAYPGQLGGHPLFEPPPGRVNNNIIDAYLERAGRQWGQYMWDHYLRVEELLRYRRSHPVFAYTGIRVDHNCWMNYVAYDKRIIHALGLTNAILARTEMKSDRPAHKMGLGPLALDLAAIAASSPTVGPGMYRRAVQQGLPGGPAPDWIRKNLDTIEVIDRKIYNRHHLWENLGLALTFPPKIKP